MNWERVIGELMNQHADFYKKVAEAETTQQAATFGTVALMTAVLAKALEAGLHK